jgi:P-type Ca2+ transporter type 2C
MGIRGTDVAKESAAIVLQNDRFETVAAAVEEGRVIFDNIRKFVFYLFSCNVAEIMVLLLASLAGTPIPLQPLQLLWLNIVTDTFPALALAVEPGDASVMRRPPRNPDEAILSRPFLVSIFVYGVALTAATLGAFSWALFTNRDHAGTVAFMTLALAQILHLGNARSRDDVLSPTRALANPIAIGAVALAVILQLATTLRPLARVLHVTPLGLAEWGVVIGLAALPAVAGQLFKRFGRVTGAAF